MKNAKIAILLIVIMAMAGCGNKVESDSNSQTVTEAISIVEDGKDEEETGIDAQLSDTDRKKHIVILDEEPYIDPGFMDDTPETPRFTDDMYNWFPDQVDIYDSRALNFFLGARNITLEDIIEVVDNNNNLDSRWKDIIKDFAEKVISEYPEIDMRLFYENCKRLTIEYDPYEALAGSSEDSRSAIYNYEHGVIHVEENIDFDNQYNLIVIRHELGHMISLGILKRDRGRKLVCLTNNGDYGMYFREAVAVIISSKPFEKEYYYTDFGYSIIANELELIVNAIPDFDISVLANQDIYNIAGYLGYVNYNSVPASRLIELMDLQTKDYYDMPSDEPLPEDYTEIYRYIANTYVNHVLNKNMSSEEVQQISDDIKAKLHKNVTYSFELAGIEEIDRVFNEYMNN